MIKLVLTVQQKSMPIKQTNYLFKYMHNFTYTKQIRSIRKQMRDVFL